MTENRSAQRLVLHVDMDAFYAAIETRDNPVLRGKPVIVGALPGSRGVVSTCSYEARRFGIHSAMPVSEAYRRCPHGVYLRPDMRRYSTVSRQVMKALETISPTVEAVSVDEAFLDLTGLELLLGEPADIGRRTKEVVTHTTGLTCSVGIGPNRLIAKIASDHDKPDGLTIVPATEVLKFLTPLPVSCLRGVGRVLGDQLRRFGIRTVADLHAWSQEKLALHFGATMGRMLYRQARGMASDVVGERDHRKSISKETTFGEDVTDPLVVRDTLRTLAAGVGRSARRAGLAGRCIQIKVRLAGFETHTRSHTLESATDLNEQIFDEGWKLFEQSGYMGSRIRLIGVGLSHWTSGNQLDLFSAREDQKRRNLNEVKDLIVDRFGKKALGYESRRKSRREGE